MTSCLSAWFACCQIAFLGVSGRLVGPAAFKAVEGSLARLLAGSIPVHSRRDAKPV